MRYALSTCWLPGEDGAAIADKAIELGFDALELGYVTTDDQLVGFRSRIGQIGFDSVHAFCPAPIGAPSGHPELYQICSDSPDTRALAHICLRRSFKCAAEFGAKVVVFHAAYVYAQSAVRSFLLGERRIEIPTAAERKRRRERGLQTLDVFKREFEKLAPELEKLGLVLALENLPRFEGFPNVEEAETLMKDLAGAPVALWFDTGHARIRETRTWDAPAKEVAECLIPWTRGMHLNDVVDVRDDHFAPGKGKVDFAALKPLAERDGVLHVFEPHPGVTAEDLRAGLALMRGTWG